MLAAFADAAEAARRRTDEVRVPATAFADARTDEMRIPQTAALRHNEGKVRMDLLPPDALEEEARVWTQGAVKYGERNWEALWGDRTEATVMASAMRHMVEILKGNAVDPESGCLHAAHVRANMAMLIRYQLLPPPPPAAATEAGRTPRRSR